MATKTRSAKKTPAKKHAASVATTVPQLRLLTTVEAAELLKVSVSSLMHWRQDQVAGKPPYIKVGHSVRYDESKLLEWIQSQSKQF